MSKSGIPNRAEVLLRVRNMVEVRLLHKVARKSAKILKDLALYVAKTTGKNTWRIAELTDE